MLNFDLLPHKIEMSSHYRNGKTEVSTFTNSKMPTPIKKMTYIRFLCGEHIISQFVFDVKCLEKIRATDIETVALKHPYEK